ncbi:MAG: methyltransferase domain-containing protein [Acidobacteriia bacterium]|nr:methyltransferase domain-containing protein [Terriglobia bacterium]
MQQRRGDTTKIPGDYQYCALTRGNPVQRFWHYSKQLAIKRYLPPGSGERILDVGCGSGVITSFLGESGASVLGIDSSEDAIAFASQEFSAPNVRFERLLVDDLVGLDHLSFDKIYCLELIEHIYRNQTRELFQQFRTLVKPGGKVFVTTPNYRSLWPLIEWIMDTARLAPQMSEHQHVEFFNARKLQDTGLECGFEMEESVSMCFLAPWLAPLSWRLAEKADVLESRLPFHMGSILIGVFAKKEAGQGLASA